MADDNGQGDRTEAPTPRRRQEARDKGNIPRSPDIVAAVLLVTMMVMLGWYGPGVVRALKDLMAEMLSESSIDGGMAALHTDAGFALHAVGRSLAPLFVGACLVAILTNLAQVGLYFDVGRLQPNLGALNPLRGLGRVFGGGNGNFVKLLMNLAKMLLVTFVAYTAVHGKIGLIISAQKLSALQAFHLGGSVIYSILIRVGLILFILAIADYIYQRYRIEQSLKMSKQEVKDEMRSMEGDPKIKARRRQIALQRIIQGIKKDVPTADVVVTNPTHYAIALKYDSESMHAPRVVAKGQDLIALRIREIAAASGVPILERKPLARALYKMCKVGQEIPEEFYSTVAEILAYVYELSGKMKGKKAG
jgi:flagellar biosynthetic protein FlhB